jgi:2-(1,2-epoxy-1,2-dihydrophenyl)acetyl-CoA isomerase
MEYQDIELIREEGIALLYLNRPNVLNALSETMMVELVHALKETEEDPNVRVLILTGRGPGFCAGADLNRFIQAQQKGKDRQKKIGFGLLDLPRAFVQYPKPIIAAINGLSYGFGFTVTLTCFLPRLIGYGKAAELIFTARPFDAHEALEIGAVNRVFPHNRLMPEAKKMAKQIASMPPTAVQRSKEILRHGMQSTLDQVIQYEARTFLDSMKTEEHQLALDKLLAQMKFRNVKTRPSKK